MDAVGLVRGFRVVVGSMTPDGDHQVLRLVELYDTLVELDVALHMREFDGWLVLSAGEVRPGRWWAEYERLDGT